MASVGTSPAKPAKKKGLPRWARILLVLLLVGMLVWSGRFRILRAMGDHLIRADAECNADAIYVLGGSPFDRGTRGGELLLKGCAPVAYCTGSNISAINKAEGRMVTEADLTRSAALRAGSSPARALPLPYGTSTYEEAIGILHHARSKGYTSILLVTTDFHTRRVGNVFRERFERSGITVLVHAAPSSDYDSRSWWNSEQGLLMVNNEYVKTLYYTLNY